jgi:hypothetical protein
MVSVSCSRSNPANDARDVNDPELPPATSSTGAADFPLPDDPGAQIRAAGLRELDEDAEVTTSYAHVDVIINGRDVVVPAGIGRTPSSRSPVSTTSDDGVVTIETEVPDDGDEPPAVTLGQFFTQWGVRLDKSCVATYCTDETNQLLGIVDGQLVGDPASIAFADQEQIVVWFGPRGTNPSVPVSYDFPTTTR